MGIWVACGRRNEAKFGELCKNLEHEVSALTLVDFFLGALTGVCGNALTAVLSDPTQKTVEKIRDVMAIGQSAPDVLRPIVAEAINGAAEISTYGEARLQTFMQSPEVEGLVMSIFAHGILDEENAFSITDVRSQFVTLMALHMGRPQDEVRVHAEIMFGMLLKTCDAFLTLATEKNVLAAHEAKSTLRFNLLRDLISAIQKRQEYLTSLLHGERTVDIPGILEFEKKYREVIEDQFGVIVPPNLDNQRTFPMDSLYVTPDIQGPLNSNEPKRVSLQQLFAGLYRCVILGDPGAGKSTLTHKLAYDLCRGYHSRVVAGRQLTPVIVVLREYNRQKAKGLNIAQFMEWAANLDQQLQPPQGAFEYLLRNGRLIVIFDGLDELANPHDRQQIRNDVQAFAHHYPSVPVVVTSRKVGYDQAPLDPERFDAYSIAPFTVDQVREYVSKWFSVGKKATDDERDYKTQSFVRDSKEVDDLRSNPLILALMCDIFWREGYIPQNRPEVYRACANLLFRQWDANRGIEVPASFVEHLKTTIQHIAYWVFCEPDLQEGVTEADLINEAVCYLLGETFEDKERAKARIAAEDLIRYCCKGRAWVFNEAGSNAGSEPLYTFAHRTFLEYFAAAYLLERYYKPEVLWATIAPKLTLPNRSWDMVGQLTFQMSGRGARDEMYGLLLDSAVQSDDLDRFLLLEFAARTLGSVQPKPSTTRKITEMCLSECAKWGVAGVTQLASAMASKEFDPSVIIETLVQATDDNYSYIADTFEMVASDLFASDDENYQLIGVEIVYYRLRVGLASRNSRRKAELFERLGEKFSMSLDELARKHLLACRLGVDVGRVTLDEAIQRHGWDVVRRGIELRLSPVRYTMPLADILTTSIVSGGVGTRLTPHLYAIGSYVLAGNFPRLTRVRFVMRPDRKSHFKLMQQTVEVRLAVFVLFAAATEVRARRWRNEGFWATADGRRMAVMLDGRERGILDPSDDALLPRWFSDSGAELVRRWVRGEISFYDDAEEG